MSQYPSGRQPARRPSQQMMYRRRRAAVLGLLLLIIVLIIVGISRCSSGDAAVIPTTPPTQPVPAPTSSTIPNVGATPGATSTPGAPIAGVDIGYQGAEPVCATQNLKVTAATDNTAYAAGALPQLSMGLQNVGATACKVNVGTNAQVFQISSNGSLIWQSTDCQVGGVEYWVLMRPSEQINSASPLSWNREKSKADTCGAPTRDPAAAAGTTYYLTTFMGAAKSAESKAFTLN